MQSAGTPLITGQQLTEVSATRVHPLGTRVRDRAGNEYIYLQGIASVVAGDWVNYDDDGLVTRSSGTATGPVAIALAAVVADRYGWFQIYGTGSAKVVATGSSRVYLATVTGQALATMVTGALIHGARTAPGTGNTVTGDLTAVQISYPYTNAASGSY